MNRRPTSISLPDLAPAPGAHALARLDGDMLFLQHESSLLALSLQKCQIAWGFTHTKPAPDHYCVPRRLRTNGRRIWSDGERVVHLFDTPDGARVQASRRVDGRALWHRDLVTPAPLGDRASKGDAGSKRGRDTGSRKIDLCHLPLGLERRPK
jgi:hypothetical protein